MQATEDVVLEYVLEHNVVIIEVGSSASVPILIDCNINTIWNLI